MVGKGGRFAWDSMDGRHYFPVNVQKLLLIFGFLSPQIAYHGRLLEKPGHSTLKKTA